MSFQVSPGVLVVERDLTNIVPAVSTAIGAYAGPFQWGPVLDPVTLGSEIDLVRIFGRPNDGVATSFFSAANFLSYSNNLKMVRVVGAGARNAVAVPSGSISAIAVTGGGQDYEDVTVTISAPNDPSGIQATATATITGDAITAVAVTNAGSGYTSAPTVTISSATGTGATATATVTLGGVLVKNQDDWDGNFSNGAGAFGPFAAKYPGVLGNSIIISVADSNTFDDWDYATFFDDAPGTSDYVDALEGTNDEMHIVVIDATGLISGVVGTVLERFVGVSKARDAKTGDGASNYYKEVLRGSRYVWWMDHPASAAYALVQTAWGSQAQSSTFSVLADNLTYQLVGGTDDNAVTDGDVLEGYDLFLNDELIDVNLLISGGHSPVVGRYLIEEIAEVRKDCVAFVSPQLASVVNNPENELADVLDDRLTEIAVSSSYGVMDSGYKYQYDKYNDVFRWVPINPDVAGLCARTDTVAETWFSPGGYNRGQIKNVVRLAWSPNKAQRDELYKKGVNPVVTTVGDGTIMLGDKTLQAKPSAFDRINVRRLFIVLEKAIATAAKYQLFEFNDNFTRAQFRNLVEPFLRDVQGRRGLTDFLVVCDERNNTGEVIDRNEFVADIYLKAARSINFIRLSFVATRTGVDFSELVGG
jgi:hypothetical protein